MYTGMWICAYTDFLHLSLKEKKNIQIEVCSMTDLEVMQLSIPRMFTQKW